MTIMPDTSVMVASIQTDHIHYERAFSWRERIFRGEFAGVLAAHSLAETYSTLTRMPPPNRLSLRLAWNAVELALPSFKIVTLTESEVVAVLSDLAARQITGGQVYDALIAAVARKVNADILLNFNMTHFLRVAPDLANRIQEP